MPVLAPLDCREAPDARRLLSSPAALLTIQRLAKRCEHSQTKHTKPFFQ